MGTRGAWSYSPLPTLKNCPGFVSGPLTPRGGAKPQITSHLAVGNFLDLRKVTRVLETEVPGTESVQSMDVWVRDIDQSTVSPK